jgi:uncharacterized protein YgbK (DUF1537 family)
VRQLLAQPKNFSIQLCKPDVTLPDRSIIVGEAASADDLRLWARRRGPTMLVAGGVEFFGAVLAASGSTASHQAAIKPVAPARGARELFVCGTLSRSSREFIEASRQTGTPVFSLPGEIIAGQSRLDALFAPIVAQAAAKFNSHPRIIVSIGLPPVGDAAVAKRLHRDLAQLARAILQRVSVDEVYIEGGATARELLQLLGWPRLRVVEELARGIARLSVENGPAPYFTIKPGSYLWPAGIHPLTTGLAGNKLASQKS